MREIYRKNYVSEIDAFLRKYDEVHKTFSEAKKKEIEKHKKIAYERDQKGKK